MLLGYTCLNVCGDQPTIPDDPKPWRPWSLAPHSRWPKKRPPWRRRRFLFSPHVCWHQMGNMGNKNPIDQGIYWCWYLQFIAGCSQFFDILSDGPQLPDIEKCWAEHQQPRMKQPRGLHCWGPIVRSCIRFLHVYLQRIHWSLGHSYV